VAGHPAAERDIRRVIRRTSIARACAAVLLLAAPAMAVRYRIDVFAGSGDPGTTEAVGDGGAAARASMRRRGSRATGAATSTSPITAMRACGVCGRRTARA
jgi:hypothetical protein